MALVSLPVLEEPYNIAQCSSQSVHGTGRNPTQGHGDGTKGTERSPGLCHVFADVKKAKTGAEVPLPGDGGFS